LSKPEQFCLLSKPMPEEQPANPQTDSKSPGAASNGSASEVEAAPASDSIPASDPRSVPTTASDLPQPTSSLEDRPVSSADNQKPEVVAEFPKQTSKGRPSSAAEAKRRLTKPSSTSEDKGQSAEVVAGSKVEAIFFQIWGVVSKFFGSIGSAIRTKFVGSKLYANLQEKLKPLQPVFKFFEFVWKQLIIPAWNIVIKPLWGVGLKILRGLFTDTLKPFSDRFLTIVILGILAIVYWLFSSLTSAFPQTAEDQPRPTPVVTAPKAAPPVAVQPTPTSQPVSPTVEVPAPEQPLSSQPEQNQIIDVQTQVAQIFDQYSQDIVQSVQANFQAERLVIKVSDRWFELPQAEQNQLGTDVLERSRKLEFSKLEIRDQTNQLLAREPVVGSNIIVLQRRVIAPELMLDSPKPRPDSSAPGSSA